MPVEIILFFKPILPFIQGFMFIAAPALAIAWKIFKDRQNQQEASIKEAQNRLSCIERESRDQILELKDRIKTLELTAVTEAKLNQLMKDMADDMERKIQTSIQELKQDLKDFMKEVFNNK